MIPRVGEFRDFRVLAKAKVFRSAEQNAIVETATRFARGTVEAGAKGISTFLVSLDMPGISRTAFDDMGSRSVGRRSLFFDGVRVPASRRLGDEDRGFVQVMHGFDFSRALIGLQCLGAAKKSLDETWAYAKDRRAFDKPLVTFQGVSFPLAEAETFLEAARLLLPENPLA